MLREISSGGMSLVQHCLNVACYVRLCRGNGSGTSCVVERGTSCVLALVVLW